MIAVFGHAAEADAVRLNRQRSKNVFFISDLTRPKRSRAGRTMNDSQPGFPTLEIMRDGRTEYVCEIKGTELQIGRIPGMGLYLDDLRVSRRHALVERSADGNCYLVDLKSKCSTQVDGTRATPFQPVPLRDGSRIKIIDYELVFRHSGAAPREEVVGESTVIQSLHDLSSDFLARRSTQPVLALQAILDISRSLGGRADLDESLALALDGLMRLFPAERGFILTVEPEGTPRIRAVSDRTGSSIPRVPSRTILSHVLERGRAVLIADSAADPRFRTEDSVISSVHTALCVPLLDHDGRALGMVQLDSRKHKTGFKADDLDLLAALTVPISVAMENYRLLQEQASWSAAREIQLALLPQRRPQIAGYTFWEHYRPSLAVGGDFYDYIEIEEPRGAWEESARWVVSIGDVVGKGMPAALLAASVCPEVRYLVRGGVDLAEVLARVNRRVIEGGFDAIFVTMLLIEVDAASHRVTVANAGHAAPLLRRATGEVESIAEQGKRMPLGVEPHTVYEPMTVSLGPGDLVVLYTDGVTDAQDRNRRPLGADRLQQTLAAAQPDAARAGEAILGALLDHSSGRAQCDDVTIVCFGQPRD
jgi:serine phosphatase RsbU (regulator of sigma subunit)